VNWICVPHVCDACEWSASGRELTVVSMAQMNIRGRDNVATWLEAVSPSMPASVANTMADDAR
jgi:hypothetical protein